MVSSEASPSAERRSFADIDVGTHRLGLLRDGEETYPSMLEAIARAKSTICLETYILRSDRTGQRFAQALIERARAGVEVNVLYDAWGSSVSTSYLANLAAAGVRTLAYHPFGLGGSGRTIVGRVTRRNHKKSLIVDGLVGFTGGLNVADDYAPESLGGAGWRDTHIRIEGPAALELEYFFRYTWQRSGGAPLDEPRYGGDGRRPDPKVRIVSNEIRRYKSGIRDAYRKAIGSAKSRVLITNAYFLPPRRLLRSLAAAAQRGVDVRVMVAGTTDVVSVLYASRAMYGKLLRAGVRILEWQGRVLHAKTAVIDGKWSTVGSSNLDPQSLRHNLEVNAFVEDEAFGKLVERMFYDDAEHCQEVDLERWNQRNVLERAASWGLSLVREWL